MSKEVIVINQVDSDTGAEHEAELELHWDDKNNLSLEFNLDSITEEVDAE